MSRRLMMLTSEFPPGPGGIGTHAHQLALELAKLGWQLSVFGPQDYASRDDIVAFNERQPFPVHRAPDRHRRLGGAWGAWQALREERPDVVFASGEHVVYLAAALAKLRGQRWVAIEHGWIPTKALLPMKRWAFRAADAVISVSNYSSDKLREMGVRPRRAYTIWNGADPVRFHVRQRGRARGKLGLGDARLLVTVGTVSKRKGQDVAISALPAILAEHPSTHYVMAGCPDLADELRAHAARLGVSERVHFLGKVDNELVVDLLNDADIALLTSRHVPEGFEGFGIAVIEAALCGTTSVVTANSGLAEAVVADETGLVVPPEDPPALAAAVNRLLADATLRTRLGDAARMRALRELTWAQVARKYSDVLAAIAEAHA
ncbi:MAG TPA: glycosyltransferase family 4 protein [Kofleriaceae bacterium]|nr:glycosyltransferase family 4 protein [Kofleriaceae bacterium]